MGCRETGGDQGVGEVGGHIYIYIFIHSFIQVVSTGRRLQMTCCPTALNLKYVLLSQGWGNSSWVQGNRGVGGGGSLEIAIYTNFPSCRIHWQKASFTIIIMEICKHPTYQNIF